jgi:hypothetical protein
VLAALPLDPVVLDPDVPEVEEPGAGAPVPEVEEAAVAPEEAVPELFVEPELPLGTVEEERESVR